jgi:hypothetical protein
MRISLRNIFMASAVLATAALATSSAMAETLNVPFNFTVAGKRCPAGTYTVKRDPSHNVVTLSSNDASRSFTWVVGPGQPEPGNMAVVLRFDEQGDNHALSTVQYHSAITPKIDKKTRELESVPSLTVEGR